MNKIFLMLSILFMSCFTNAAEEEVLCFEAKYYHPENRMAHRYSSLIPAEDNDQSDVDVMLSVYIDVSESRQVDELWRKLTREKVDQWVCARGSLHNMPGQAPGRLIDRVSMGFVAFEMWVISQEAQIPKDALVLERY